MTTWLTIFGPTTHGEDAATVARNVRASGADGLICFTSLYHGYRLIQRRYPRKAIYSLEAEWDSTHTLLPGFDSAAHRRYKRQFVEE